MIGIVETKYLRMIQGMKRRGPKDWTVYILRCGYGSLYTGIAKDAQARVKQHSEGRGGNLHLNSPARQAVISTGRLDAFQSSYSRSIDESNASVQERGNHL